MKPIKILALAALCTIAFSCKKKEETSNHISGVDYQEANTVVDALSQEDHSADAMLEEAKSKPLTTIALSEADFSFGDIKKGEKVEHVYEVTNTGKNPLIISAVKPGCGCTAPEYTKDPILPGQKGKITLRFDSSNFDGAVNKLADVYANVENAPIKLSFSANITQ